jgi:hypothetical protein
VTRKDKITSEIDRMKIDRRLARETADLFNARMFVSLTNAIRAREGGNAIAWAESGAQEFSDMLEQIVEGVTVQRSFMLARYTVGEPGSNRATTLPRPDVEDISAAGNTDTGAILGFVTRDQVAAAPQQPEIGTGAPIVADSLPPRASAPSTL